MFQDNYIRCLYNEQTDNNADKWVGIKLAICIQ